MGTCIICGTSVDDGRRVCKLHEEDVVFEFLGNHANQLTAGRYYRGTVDGFADFGIFVDIGDSVTGLLHRSELNKRLESIDLDPGDTLFVQVQSVRDNGNVDLGWSIRQEKSRFRGVLIEDPQQGEERLPDDDTDSEASQVVRKSPTPNQQQSTPHSDAKPEQSHQSSSQQQTQQVTTDDDAASASATESPESSEPPSSEPQSATVTELDELVGKRVRLEGEISSIRQTGGPTIFELRDETGTVECAAFKEAGVRAYPAIEQSDIVRIEGEVERRRGELQVETDALVELDADERESVSERMADALLQRARPGEVVTLTDDSLIDGLTDELRDVATAIRRAVIEERPVIVRHAGTVDGYVAGAALERATLPLVREHGGADAEYHQFERRPIDGSVYTMDDATRDVTRMLSNRHRHGEAVPLFVFVAAGSPESVDGFGLLDVYDVRRVLIDGRPVADDVAAAVDVTLASPTPTTTTRLAANVAATIAPEIRDDILHLPAVSDWDSATDAYLELAEKAGYDGDSVRVLREALAVGAYYQSYEDKRELVSDLLFAADEDVGLAEHVSQQYRTRMDTAIETADANLDEHDVAGRTVLALDTEAYTHRFEFPDTALLLDELFRRHPEADALIGVGRDECHVRTNADVAIESVVATAREHAPAAALDARGARDGRIEFLAGEREAARDALITALADAL